MPQNREVLVLSGKTDVIPAKVGIQNTQDKVDSRLRGNDN